jgi:hypothetical protein
MKKLLASGVLCIALQGCGYFERDGILQSKAIAGNFKIEQQENSAEKNLVFAETPEVSAVIIVNSKKVVYDPDENKILASEFIDDHNENFYVIDILDERAGSVSGACAKRKITGADLQRMSDCPSCIVME